MLEVLAVYKHGIIGKLTFISKSILSTLKYSIKQKMIINILYDSISFHD